MMVALSAPNLACNSLTATGRAFSIPGVTVVVRRNGKIVRESLYYNMAEVQRQLGAK